MHYFKIQENTNITNRRYVAQIELSQIECSIFQIEHSICDTQLLFAKHGHTTREQMFPTPSHSLPLFVQTIKIDSCEQIERLENIRYGRVVPDELRETTINAVPLVYDRFQVPTP